MVDNQPIDTLNQAWKNDKSRFGYRMLQKMGWKEDKGLGKEENGNISHIKIKKREESLGIGMERPTDSAGYHGWSTTATSYNEILMTLKEAYRPNPQNDSDEIDSKQKKQKKEKKDKKKEKSSKSTIISVGIKYKKLSSAKRLKDKSPSDLQAILGVPIASSAFSQQQSISVEADLDKYNKRMREQNSDSDAKDESEDNNHMDISEREKKRKSKKSKRKQEEDD